MHDLDPSRPDTLINAPAPYLPEWFSRELERLGGKQLDGTPNLKIVWGQTERKFACGRQRVKYPTPFMAEKETEHFRIRDVATNGTHLATFGEFMAVKEKNDADLKRGQLTPTQLAEYRVERQIEWIGLPRWIIEQYKPVVMIQDSPSAWERNRFNWWWNPETRRQEWTDINGPFPYNGRYEHFLTVKTDDGTHNGKYRAPTEDSLDEVRKAIIARSNYKPLSAAKEVEKFVAAKEAKLAASERELSDEIADSLAPHVGRMYETQTKFYNAGTKPAKRKEEKNERS